MAKENKNTAITNSSEKSIPEKIREMKRFEQTTGFSYREGKFIPKKGKKQARKYDPGTINSTIDGLDKSKSMNGEEAKELAKAAKERGKSDGFIAGALVVGIAWLSNKATNWVLEKFDKA